MQAGLETLREAAAVTRPDSRALLHGLALVLLARGYLAFGRPDDVRAAYRMVFRHDRAGRLVDAQEFEHLAFDRDRFDPRLLAELLASCAERVRVTDGRVVISHLYTERRLRPLDVFLREADHDEVRHAVIDYGQALRDLAATNVFPGDILLKNFGVSRHGRLIFYDYDELCLVSECRFRRLPTAQHDDEELHHRVRIVIVPFAAIRSPGFVLFVVVPSNRSTRSVIVIATPSPASSRPSRSSRSEWS